MFNLKSRHTVRIGLPVELGHLPLKTAAVQEDSKVKRISLSFKLVSHKSYANKLYIPNQDTGYATFRTMDRK